MIFSYEEITPQVRRPIIPVLLTSETTFIIYRALVDSGADYCIFSIDLAYLLGIKLSSRDNVSFTGVDGEKIEGFWGEVEIRIGGISYKTKAIFAEISEFGHGILGHKGFFDQFDVKLSYQKQTIEIEPHDILDQSDQN